MQSRKKVHLLAVDPSLTQSGWALFSLQEERPLCWGVLKSEGTSVPLGERLLGLHRKVVDLFSSYDLSNGDYVVCEGPAPVSLNPSSAIKVEQVRGIFEGIARMRGVEVPGRLNPRTVQTELLGMRGKQVPRAEVKQTARTVLMQMYSSSRRSGDAAESADYSSISQDAVDAILLGVLARAKLRHAISAGIPLAVLFEGGGSGGSSGRSGRRMRWSATQVKVK